MFSGVSNFVEGVDTAFVVILGISLFFLVAVTATMIYFVMKYSRKKNPKAGDVKDNTKLEILWTVIPTLLVLGMFYYGWAGYRPMKQIPDGAFPIKVTGKMWSWTFEYENGKWDSLLVVPKNKPIKLDMNSPDVVHSLYIPAFRIKEDLVPGVPTQMWFEANEEGEYDILCAEYCGERHSYMLSKVVVLSQEEFDKWYNSESDVDRSVHPGLDIMRKNGCMSCHSTDGSKLVGPTFKGLLGSDKEVKAGDDIKLIKADAEYINRSITAPNKEVVVGFNSVMPAYDESRISKEDKEKIIEYLKEIK